MDEERAGRDIRVAAAVCVLLAAAVRLPLFHASMSSPSADEAVFGLMATKIMRGEDLPVFCWGAHYAGALVSYIAAALFALFGASTDVLRAATLPFALGAVALGAVLGAELGGSAGAWTLGLLLALPPPVFAEYSIAVLGGHTETVFFGLLVLLLAERLRRASDGGRPTRPLAAGLGLAAGVGTWILVAVVPFVLAAIWRVRGRRYERGVAAAAFLAGASPAIVYNLVHPLASLRRGAGRAIGATAFDRAHLLAAPVEFLGGGLVGASLLLLVAFFFLFAARRFSHLAVLLAAQTALLVALGLGRERHMIPLYVTASVALAALAGRWPNLISLLAVALLVSNGLSLEPRYGARGPDFRPLIGELRTAGIRYLATDYNIAYPVTFLAREEIIAAPIHGPDTTDRWPPYSAAVRAAIERGEPVAYVRHLGDSVVIRSLPDR